MKKEYFLCHENELKKIVFNFKQYEKVFWDVFIFMICSLCANETDRNIKGSSDFCCVFLSCSHLLIYLNYSQWTDRHIFSLQHFLYYGREGRKEWRIFTWLFGDFKPHKYLWVVNSFLFSLVVFLCVWISEKFSISFCHTLDRFPRLFS